MYTIDQRNDDIFSSLKLMRLIILELAFPIPFILN